MERKRLSATSARSQQSPRSSTSDSTTPGMAAGLGARFVISDVSDALVDADPHGVPDLPAWFYSLSTSNTTGIGTSKAALALIAIEPHPHMINRPLL